MTEAPAGFLMDVPARLGRRGAALWVAVTGGVDMRGKPAEVEILLEACRCADRLEKLDELLSGDVETWRAWSFRVMTVTRCCWWCRARWVRRGSSRTC